jgi:hypothetical protein
VHAFYGLKSSGAAWSARLAETLFSLEFTPCLADPDVWYKAANKPCREAYYEYILVYVDDILVISQAPPPILESIGKVFKFKDGSIRKPTKYLGADVIEYTLLGSTKPKWAFSSTQYVQGVVRNVEIELEKTNYTLVNTATTPTSSSYRPELDVTPVLDAI